MSEHTIRYGRDTVTFNLPADCDAQTLAGKPMHALPDPVRRLQGGLDDPFGCAPLKFQAPGKANAVIVVADYTRNYAYPLWLPELLDQLNSNGLPDASIQLYVGSGTHRAMTDAEKVEAFGEQVVGRVAILDHDCDAMERMKKIGRTSYGTIAYIDERVFNAELLILTGGIQFHYFAGYSGGRKALLPGCSARESILHNHSLALDKSTGRFAAGVLPGVAVGNPVNEDMMQVASQLRPDMCINVVLNDDKEIAWLGVGDHGYKLRRGAMFLDEHNMVDCATPADIAFIGAGGHPKDLTLFQAHKSLRHSVAALRPGAKVFWLARCEQGEGTDHFKSYSNLTLDECISRVKQEISLYSLCSLSLKMLAEEYDVHMISELPDERVREWGFKPFRDIQSALSAGLPQCNSLLSYVVIPDCSNLLPVKPKINLTKVDDK